jgi:aryl-alcohol dehydrogenase-like predicted oxidoreductase
MPNAAAAGTFVLGDRVVNCLGYGAMQLAGPGVFGPPRDKATAIAVLREAVKLGMNHIDTSDFYGPHVTTAAQIAQNRGICEIVCVQNLYNLADRSDAKLVQQLAKDQLAYVAYFPLGGMSLVQSDALSSIAHRFDATPTTQVALAWLLQHAPNILPIPGTSSLVHLRENLAAATLAMPAGVIKELDAVSATIGITDCKDRN